jgi:hypothetical protein
VLMHKVLLEGDEARYLRTANVARFERLDFPTWPWRRPGA